jgi:hypothetical protein
MHKRHNSALSMNSERAARREGTVVRMAGISHQHSFS